MVEVLQGQNNSEAFEIRSSSERMSFSDIWMFLLIGARV